MQNNNSIWQFFASVKLALLILSLIAVTSIIGTVIPQKESAEFYVQNYGPSMAHFFSVLDIPDMYTSWWFLALLFLLAFNLVICSFDRFPGVWKQIKADGLQVSEDRLEKMGNRYSWQCAGTAHETGALLRGLLVKKGWKFSSRESGDSTLLFSQKGNWTRAGVYIVHTSILVIFLGAIIGSLAGFKGSVLIPETMDRDRVFLYGSGEAKELGFTVRCNSFAIEFYPNGTPKEYTSSLTIIENGQEIITKMIEVNDPLSYRGITFYQSSYEAYQDFVITIQATASGEKQSFVVPFQQQGLWEEEHLKFGVINAKAIGQSIVESKLWFSDGKAEPTLEWLDDGATLPIQTEGGEYLVSTKQMYATGLQVAKDPGVWWVYIGCGLMLFGLYVAFFMSHKRIWLLITPADKGSRILFTGSANKNRQGFESQMAELKEQLCDDGVLPETKG
jgi:cytochrome c biogenesis protein